MEASEEATTYVAKGKRTKRLRVLSPIHPANSSSEEIDDGGGSGCGDGGVAYDHTTTGTAAVNTFNDVYVQEINNNNTDEEEDMANCLILLAKGGYKPTKNNNNNNNNNNNGLIQKVGDHNNINNNNNININMNTNFSTKFTSRKFLETANSTGSGKIGYYVYQCKTCNRTFPSFQALGGHRASHKKPNNKAMVIDVAKRHGVSASSDAEEEGQFKNNNNISSPLSLRLSDHHQYNNNYNNFMDSSSKGVFAINQNPNKGKVHECSICGAEFTSGQALGGHMRRHRGPVVGGGGAGGGGAPIGGGESEEGKKARNVFSLDLDLNLPAPEDDKMPFASKQQQQQEKKSPIVFTSPALVDCHY